MAFINTIPLPSTSKRSRRSCVCAKYLSANDFDMTFDTIDKTGNFGAVFFGEYANNNGTSNMSTDIVVKCPVDSDFARELYKMEKYTNVKLNNNCANNNRFAPYLGEVILPPDVPIPSGLARLGLVWRRVGNGDTLEDFLTSSRIFQLASLLGTNATPTPLRRSCTARLLQELALILQDIQSCGIVHRDIKPENIVVVPENSTGGLFNLIDFGSSCDWNTPFKKGIQLATCDPIYAAPEKRLGVFKPALRFDVYSIGLIGLRCAFPSLTEGSAMTAFVQNCLSKCGFSFTRTCSAISSGRIQTSADVKSDINAICSPSNEDMYALFATLLTSDPEDRADVSDCLRSRFLASNS